MSQADSDIQLQVWKDLAISKQILMGAATDALGLNAECTTSELKEALQKATSRNMTKTGISRNDAKNLQRYVSRGRLILITSDVPISLTIYYRRMQSFRERSWSKNRLRLASPAA